MAALLLLIVHSGRRLVRPLLARMAASTASPALVPTALAEAEPTTLAAFTPEVRLWGDHISRWAQQYQLDPALIATVIQIESCGDPLAQSSAGAAGLFQVMPFHFQTGQNPMDIETNASAGLTYLARSYQLAGGDWVLTLAGYNGGHGVIESPQLHWPEQTQRYAAWGAGILNDIRAGDLPSPTLARWLEAGGHSLCQQASNRALASR
jgi:soluble lytic murein transglycosylase-like protein